MSVPQTVNITGTIRSVTGELYEGAVIEVYLQNQMFASDNMIGNAIQKTYSNSYGKFNLTLVPSALDNTSDNYYVFRIIKDTVNVYHKIVPSVTETVDFEDLRDYVPAPLRPQYIGRSGEEISAPTIDQSDLGGIFQATQFNGDGATKTFTAPGKIFFVALNGIVQSAGIDYAATQEDVAEFYHAPDTGDLIALFYRI